MKFDLYSNNGEGTDSTGLYVNGAWPTTPAVDMTSSGVNLHTTDVFNVQIIYDGTNLTMTITDTVTNATFTHAWPINIPTTVGGNTALVGFTGGTGGLTAIQEIIGWTLSSSTTGVAATPTFSPVAGTYTTRADGDHQRYNEWRNDLLHDERDNADDFIDEVHSPDHG